MSGVISVIFVTLTELGFAGAMTRAQHLCGSWWPAYHEQQTADESRRSIEGCPGGRRRSRNLRGPELAADQRESIAEGRQRLGIPAHALKHRPTLDGELAGPQCHEREQREERRRGAQDGQVGPLPLGFHAGVTPSLFEGGLDSPAANEPAQDVDRRGLLVGAEEGLRLLLATRVAHQHPTDRHPCAAVRPEGGGGGDIEPAGTAAIPAINDNPAPTRAPVAQALGRAGLPCPLDWRPTSPPRPARRGWVVQASIETQAGDYGQVRREVTQQGDDRE